MLECNVIVCNRLGLHARAAARLVRTASRFTSDIRLERSDRSAAADAKSILSVLLLAASRGTHLSLRTHGDDEQHAMNALQELFQCGFGEEVEPQPPLEAGK
jgi:phosphotransferase system HPr (HPr) family protein